jgi:hypothetical protein
MNRFLLSGLFLIPLFAFAQTDGDAENANRLALQAIDSICADTWCEGDLNYRFDSLNCDFSRGRCRLEYRSGEWPAEGMPMRFTSRGRCWIRNVRSYSDLIETTPLLRLKDGPYEQLTDCLR